jgi:hypothetical protein
VRLDPERPFAPDNVRFGPVAEVSRHTAALRRPVVPHSLTAFGETKGLMERARERGCLVTMSTLSTRLHCGLAPEAAIATPPQQGRGGLLPRPERKQVPIRAATDWARGRRLAEGGADPRGRMSSCLARSPTGCNLGARACRPPSAPRRAEARSLLFSKRTSFANILLGCSRDRKQGIR